MSKNFEFPVTTMLVYRAEVEHIYRNRITTVMAANRPESNLAQDVLRVWCKYCRNSDAEFYCKNCGDSLCSQCHDIHINHQSFKYHITVPYNERQFAGVHCMEHPTQFYSSGCKDCNVPICPECKLKYHKKHKDTSIAKVCYSARKQVKMYLKQLKARRLRVTSLINEGTRFGNSEGFKQIKEKLQNRALRMKSCVENILSESLAEVERLEEAHQTSLHKYLTTETDDLREKIHICTKNLESMGPLELAFFQEKNMNWNQTDVHQEMKIPRFNPKQLEENDMINLFGHLSFEEINAGSEMTDVLATDLHTEPRPYIQERRSPKIPVTYTDRYEKRRLISTSFGSIDNAKRVEMGICESPNQIVEFESCENILYQITYSEQLSCVFISGDKPTIYTYKKVFGVRDGESKLDVLAVSREPQGLAIGWTGNLIYSDGLNGVLEIEPNVIDAIQHHSVFKLQRKDRFIFNKKGYTAWGVHRTKSGEILICLVPSFEGNNYAAVVKITLNIDHTEVGSESEFSHKSSGEPLFSKPSICL